MFFVIDWHYFSLALDIIGESVAYFYRIHLFDKEVDLERGTPVGDVHLALFSGLMDIGSISILWFLNLLFVYFSSAFVIFLSILIVIYLAWQERGRIWIPWVF